jgi:ligand-binding sensor domain-containing protein
LNRRCSGLGRAGSVPAETIVRMLHDARLRVKASSAKQARRNDTDVTLARTPPVDT